MYGWQAYGITIVVCSLDMPLLKPHRLRAFAEEMYTGYHPLPPANRSLRRFIPACSFMVPGVTRSHSICFPARTIRFLYVLYRSEKKGIDGRSGSTAPKKAFIASNGVRAKVISRPMILFLVVITFRLSPAIFTRYGRSPCAGAI